MINLTDRPHFLTSGDQLHGATQDAICRVIALLEEQLEMTTRPAQHKFAFVELFRPGTLPVTRKYDVPFVLAAFDASQYADSSPSVNAAIQVLKKYSTGKPPPAPGHASLKRGAKLLLVELWSNGHLLLPTVFTVGAHFPVDKFAHPLLEWIRTFAPEQQNGSADGRRMYYYGPRLLWTTDWREAKDVALDDIAALTRARALHQQGKSTIAIAGGGQLPLGVFAANLQRDFPNAASFTASDLARYANWSASHSIGNIPFEDYDPTKIQLEQRARERAREQVRTTSGRAHSVKSSHPEGELSPHEIMLRAFCALKGRGRDSLDWRTTSNLSYPGREHVDLTAYSSLWLECFRAFMHHRKVVKGYRDTSEALAALNLLADYLFYYLPWWKEVFPGSKVDLPSSPRMFSRYAFVVRSTAAPPDEVPAPLLDLIRMRRPSNDAAAIATHQLNLFFEFVATDFADNEDTAGQTFKSPINPKFDAPRSDTKSKTTKEIIPKHIYGYLLYYCYAVEEFGMHLEAMAKSGELSIDRNALRGALRFNTNAFGHVPVVTYRGRSYPLASVPNVFTWAERRLKGQSGAGVYIPHCSALRMLIVSLESGLRLQSVQWLDKLSWRRLGEDTPEESYTFPLLVNTDKTKTDSWKTFVVHRVWRLLHRQEAFQDQFADADAFGPVDYEGLDYTPFDSIRPLFRSTGAAKPISDSLYHGYWQQLMVDFEAFHREVTGERHVRMYRLRPRLHDDGTPIIMAKGEAEERPYCPISILAKHTPHACRATFATNRKGVLELSDTAALIGHEHAVTTAHYDKPGEEDLRDRLEKSDIEIFSDFEQFEADSGVHVRPDKPDSALVKSFSRDREATVKAFKFMPSIALWLTDDSKFETDGLALLKSGPMSRIRFRETHICPVGEECPADILEQIGEPRRCGMCPLAMKCVEHLPPIAAKLNLLKERIKFQRRRLAQLEALGEPEAVRDEVWESIDLDTNELRGWQFSEDVLLRMKDEAPSEGEFALHVLQPEVVKRHLKRVSRSCTTAEFLLQRIADSNAYPSMATAQVQLFASQLKRRLLAGKGLDTLSFEEDGLDDVRGVASMLALMMKAEGLSMGEAAARLAAPPHAASPALTIGAQRGN